MSSRMQLFRNEFKDELVVMLKAGVRAIAIESYEWQRCTSYLIKIMNKDFSDIKMIFINPLEGCKLYQCRIKQTVFMMIWFVYPSFLFE